MGLWDVGCRVDLKVCATSFGTLSPLTWCGLFAENQLVGVLVVLEVVGCLGCLFADVHSACRQVVVGPCSTRLARTRWCRIRLSIHDGDDLTELLNSRY